MKKSTKTIFYLIILFFIVSSCKKGEYIDQNQEFISLKLQPLNKSIEIKSVSYEGAEFFIGSGNILIPVGKKDSLNMVLNFKSQPSKQFKILNKPGGAKFTVFYDNIIDSTISVGPHPLEDVNPKEGYVGYKFFGLNKQLSPDGKPFHLVIEEVDGKIVPGQSANYKLVDTIFNISNTIPKNFSYIKNIEDGIYYRFKCLNQDKSEIIINNKPLYFFHNPPTNLSFRIVQTQSNLFLRFTNDINSQTPNPNGGYRILSLFTTYLEK